MDSLNCDSKNGAPLAAITWLVEHFLLTLGVALHDGFDAIEKTQDTLHTEAVINHLSPLLVA